MTIPRSDASDSTTAPRRIGEDAFELFFRAQYGPTVRLAHLLSGSNAVAEELAQDSFARVYGRFDDLIEPKAYLRATTVNVCRNWLRATGRERDRFRRHGVSVESVVDATDEMIELIAALPYRQRAVLVLRYWLDLSEADIADALGCRPGTVKSLHFRGLSALRKELP